MTQTITVVLSVEEVELLHNALDSLITDGYALAELPAFNEDTAGQIRAAQGLQNHLYNELIAVGVKA